MKTPTQKTILAPLVAATLLLGMSSTYAAIATYDWSTATGSALPGTTLNSTTNGAISGANDGWAYSGSSDDWNVISDNQPAGFSGNHVSVGGTDSSASRLNDGAFSYSIASDATEVTLSAVMHLDGTSASWGWAGLKDISNGSGEENFRIGYKNGNWVYRDNVGTVVSHAPTGDAVVAGASQSFRVTAVFDLVYDTYNFTVENLSLGTPGVVLASGVAVTTDVANLNWSTYDGLYMRGRNINFDSFSFDSTNVTNPPPPGLYDFSTATGSASSGTPLNSDANGAISGANDGWAYSGSSDDWNVISDTQPAGFSGNYVSVGGGTDSSASRLNDSAFSYSIASDATEVTLSVVLHIDGNTGAWGWAGLKDTSNGSGNAQFWIGYDGGNWVYRDNVGTVVSHTPVGDAVVAGASQSFRVTAVFDVVYDTYNFVVENLSLGTPGVALAHDAAVTADVANLDWSTYDGLYMRGRNINFDRFFIDSTNVTNPPPLWAEVLALNPVGYWPADEGSGNVLHDLSGRKNHGKIYNVPWRKGGLIFENDIFQWVQVPYKKEFGAKSFSMGGWVYNGMDVPPTNGMYGKGGHDWNVKNFGIPEAAAIVMGQPFTWIAKEPYQGMPAMAGEKSALRWQHVAKRMPGGVVLRIFPDHKRVVSQFGVASGGQEDVLDTLNRHFKESSDTSMPSGAAIEPLAWQHVIYTYEGGKGSLYFNGKLVKTESGIPYKEGADTPLVIGGGKWATPNAGTVSFDGSLRHMVFFDRSLKASEVTDLCKATRPTTKPDVRPNSQLLPHRKWLAAKEKNNYNFDQLIARVQNEGLDELSRGKAAIQLAAMGEKAKSAIPVLVAELQQMTDADGIHLPKVEEFFRNALISALLKIDRKDAGANQILAKAFAKPFFDKLDTSKAYFAEISPLIEAGKTMEALAAYKAHMDALPALPERTGWGSTKIAENLDNICKHLPLKEEYFDRYLSRGLPFREDNYYAYSPYESRDGTFYTTVLERVPFDEVQRQFNKHLSRLTDKQPKSVGTKKQDLKLTKEWTRVKIVKISPDGKREYAYLHGEWFIFDGRDAKMNGWSIITDQKGYLHVLGGQHNSPNQDNYIPGSWEKLGIAKGKDRASVMYWVSKKPNDITDFEFVGQKNNPRKAPGWMNYMNFSRSRDQHIFLYGRGAMWTWAMMRYDDESRRWVAIKGSHAAMLNRAKQENPQWYDNLGDTVPYWGPADGLIVSWQPGMYNFCRAWSGICKGVTFDLDNRMHLQMQHFGVREGGKVGNMMLYAYSDDYGQTFHRADGKRLHLPLTANPIPSHNADQTIEPAKSHFDVWASLVKEFIHQ